MGCIAILGGTGPEGIGLGLRFALVGEEVRIGSRDEARAQAAANGMVERLGESGCATRVTGHENAGALDGADLVVVAFPFDGVATLLPRLAPALAGRVVLDAVNPLVMEKGVFRLAPVPEGSAAEAIQTTLSESQVVSAFKNESAEDLKDIARPLHGDVLVCSNHAEARKRVLELVNRIPDVRGVDAGVLINARALESITALLLNLNRRHRARTSIHILGLPEASK
jgi:hypothetical protein